MTSSPAAAPAIEQSKGHCTTLVSSDFHSFIHSFGCAHVGTSIIQTLLAVSSVRSATKQAQWPVWEPSEKPPGNKITWLDFMGHCENGFALQSRHTLFFSHIYRDFALDPNLFPLQLLLLLLLWLLPRLCWEPSQPARTFILNGLLQYSLLRTYRMWVSQCEKKLKYFAQSRPHNSNQLTNFTYHCRTR